MSALENFPRITPFLWFDSNAEEAVDFHCTVFKNSRRLHELRAPHDSHG
jgi:predicted 3-demethylubiquinone-9 3-methyltransferase (glyoxalase superfamily)